MPKVSVIIPCFNLGKYVREAIDSVLTQTFRDFEIIVVNDGSTDAETNSILSDLDESRIKVIITDNQGLPAARNNGIAQATGDYILPLDADDKIADSYLEKAVGILDENENTGIVYCRAEFFGAENFKWDLPDYELSRMLVDNLIFCSAFFRRADWKSTGGYKPSMIYGWEDYDFWLSIIESGREVYRIPEHLFYYRRRRDSMAEKMSSEHLYYSYKQIVKNHKNLYVNNIEHIFQYIYSLRDIISEQQRQQIAKDTHVHNLNLEISNLTKHFSDLNAEISNLNGEISNLNGEISNLKAQLSSGRRLARLLFKTALKRLTFKT